MSGLGSNYSINISLMPNKSKENFAMKLCRVRTNIVLASYAEFTGHKDHVKLWVTPLVVHHSGLDDYPFRNPTYKHAHNALKSTLFYGPKIFSSILCTDKSTILQPQVVSIAQKVDVALPSIVCQEFARRVK